MPRTKSRGALAALLVLVSAAGSMPGEAREVHRQATMPTLLQQADAAFAAGDRERAQKLYRAVLAADPENSRALFQLARLVPGGSAEAIALLQHYLALEPQDPWGRMALGDALAKAGRVDAAIEQYHRARRQAPGEADVYVGLGRILHDAGHTDELVANYEDWTARQPQNAAAWLGLGRARQQAHRFPEAAEAYARSLAIKPDTRTQELLEAMLAESAPSLRPYVGRSHDSDDNIVGRYGVDGEWPLTARSRLGLHAEHAEVRDPFTSGRADELALIGRWQPRSLLNLDGAAGVSRLRANQPDAAATDHPLTRLRLRWRGATDGAALELRLAQNPLIAAPGLIAQPVDLTEGKGSLETPQLGPWLVRARGQDGRLESSADANHRAGYQLGPVFRWQPAMEIGLSYSELGYDHPTTAGYFAPRRVQIVELGAYIEYERLWPLTFALDAGGGQQCVMRFGETSCGWIDAYRFWGLVSWALKPGVHLDLELEHDNSPVAGDAVTPTAQWKSNSVILSVRFGVWPWSARSFLTERAGRSSIPSGGAGTH